MACFSFAQQYPVNNNYGNSNNYSNNNSYYGDNYDYPDDYYYDYPTDYYPSSYYQSYYNDYRNSIISINWPKFFRKYHLNRFQIDQIIYLNQLYPSFSVWDSYYGTNPDRWYYERFYALQNILGPQIFIVFQKHYYHGYNPVVYFQNYRKTYYVPRYHVQRQYRNVNIVQYKVDRNNYKNPRANNGLYDPNNRNTNNNLQNRNLDGNNSTRQNNGFRNETKSENSQSVRNINTENTRNNGFRTESNSENVSPRRYEPKMDRSENSRIRNENSSSRNVEVSNTRKSEISNNSSNSRGGGRR